MFTARNRRSTPTWLRRKSKMRCLVKKTAVLVGIVVCAPLASLAMRAVVAAGAGEGKTAYTKADYYRQLKEDSNWGRWGANDELGTLNLITPAKRKQAA